jgi:ribosomal-protein-alanine N-acetyltransferase
MHKFLITTANLGLRPVSDADFKYISQLALAEPAVWSSSPAAIQEQLDYDKKQFIKNGYGAFLVFELDTGNFIGRAGFGDIANSEVEVGYIVLEQHRGKGYATLILKALLAWAKQHIKKEKIIAITAIENIVSARVMQKAGMQFSRRSMVDGIDSVIYEFSLKS